MTDEAKIRKLERRAAWLKFKRHFVFSEEGKAFINAKIFFINYELYFTKGFQEGLKKKEDKQ